MPSANDSPAPQTVSLEPIPQQIGRYRILERLGTGGMGAVYRASDPQLDRVVAIKVPLFDVPRQQLAQRIQRFQREARAAAQVWHPHVCPIYDVGEHEGQPYVVMAYIEGRSLAERLSAGRFEEPVEAVTLMLQLLDALEAVHARGIIHRDLKPGNIMLDAAGRAILMDFGLARPEQDGEHLTSDGVVLGTPSYMAPEQATGQAERIGPWTDLYSLGVVLYQMLTGRLPFEGPPLMVLSKIVNEAPPLPRSLRPDLAPGLEAVLLQALARDSRSRYQSARAFAENLRGCLCAAATTGMLASGVIVGPTSGTDATLAGGEVAPIRAPASAPSYRPRRFDFLIAAIMISSGAILLLVSFAIPSFGGLTKELSVALFVLGWAATLCLLAAVLTWILHALRGGRQDPRAALSEAAELGQVERIKRLIRRGVDLEARDEMGETALMKAAHKGYINTVKLLLANGADVHAKNPFGETALSLAARQGRTYIAELLRQAGATK